MKTAIANPSAELISAGRPQLDRNLRLKDVLKTLPKDVFDKNQFKAWFGFISNVVLVSLGWWGIAIAPWYLLPLLWLFTGTGFFGLFVIAHDCGHRSFANKKWVNNLVGHIALTPCIYPFHPWRIEHNIHHKHTNHIDRDNTWNPFYVEQYQALNSFEKIVYRSLHGKFWWLGSIVHWAQLHFQWWTIKPGKEREQFKFSALLVIAQMAIGFPLLIATTGWWGWFSLWCVPWFVFHFWLSTVTLLHHTLPDLKFEPDGKWHEVTAQLVGSTDCKYPWWFEWICHDINVHVPHHLTTAIPWYNLRKAHASLEENWGEYITRKRFSFRLLWEITDVCHLYDEDKGYRTFSESQ
ncbi:MAG: fatty acid desaturase [Roseofilum sp. SBFL]|uniref:fatty acid desaturase n=1 Tax=Roseofilum sp. SBFL TaxID=2821496 RepID=UPI001B2C88A6|nr:fatty acid desaturase [Roseofilum sp. SBFL]MBP0041938.1 fatty acid desaturase [Roseofilum sp. SBFL]